MGTRGHREISQEQRQISQVLAQIWNLETATESRIVVVREWERWREEREKEVREEADIPSLHDN
jgi:hypothetical protein